MNFENDLAILLVTKKSKYAMLKFYQKMSHELSLIQEVRGQKKSLEIKILGFCFVIG